MTHPSLEKIHAAIPHRAPMLLVDEIVEQDQESIVCRKTFHQDEYFFQGHYPEHPLTPGVILCESAVQSGAVLLSEIVEVSGGVPVLTRMGDVKFKRMVHPGDTIENHVKLDEVVSTAYYMTAQIKCNGKMVARLSFTCTIAPSGS
ncbi:MAG: beta-hydroxyacyl-ACP dehydratase [Planctomycetaceae bacterium]|nr:beta-hydroxyacyl-ACP dehydratase [Planctomycetaceae bacterium]MCP4778944.1 beta-hydroxyacyl-ACP dehydratase [Planctomycetaceae bacterium]